MFFKTVVLGVLALGAAMAGASGALAGEPRATPIPEPPADRLLPAAFHIDGQEDVFLKVSVNGAPQVWMALDTGTDPSEINLAYAQSLGLKLGPPVNTGAGVGGDGFAVQPVEIAHLQAGSEARDHVAFETTSLTVPGPDGRPIAGMLGYTAGPDFAIGQTIRRKPVVAYIPLPPELPVDGAVGTAFLKDYKVIIDYRSQRICFEPGAPPAR